MARIPEAEIERLKNEVSVQRLVEAAGIELKKVGKDLLGLCPFHEDGTPSLSVTPAKNLWHCLGCGAGGGPIDWIIKKNGVSFRHAVELLREGVTAGVSSLAAGSGVVKHSTVKKLDAPVAFDADDQKLLNQVNDYYHQCLKQSPEALAYLESRGIAGSAAAEAIDTYKLGFANRTLGLRLPEKNRITGAEIRTRLQSIGIYRDSGHEHFNGSLIVPITDEHGNVSEMYGRKITDNLRKGTPQHLYLPGPHRGVFNVQALAAHKEIILCEALIDALTFWCAGFRNVTASYGVEGFTDDHLAAFKRAGTERVLIAYDRDDAGERGAVKLAERLQQEGIECYRIQFPKGMDANEVALKVQPAAKSLGVLIRKAAWLGKGASPAEPINTPSMAIPRDVPPASPVAVAMPAPPPLAAKAEAAPCALPASPVPGIKQDDMPCEVTDNEILFTLGTGNDARRYRVRGLAKNLSFILLKINLLVSRGDSFYVDTLDLYSMKQRQSYITHAAIELQIRDDILKTDLGRVLMRLEQLQQETITNSLQPAAPVAHPISEAERDAALALLRAPNLVERLQADCTACGLIGEDINKLVVYLAAVSRKLDKPLGIVIQSSSAAGKTSLMDTVLAFVPAEEKVKYSAMTGQSLFYMGETNLKHKALAIVEEEGAARASYALKLLQSEGELTMASTGKDPVTGNLITQPYRVEGPVALLVTTTARDIDEELMNRCLVLSVDESRDQTRAIHRLQREKRTLEGLVARREKEALITLHQNAQRLLRPIDVLNPYAQFLTFPDQTTRLRRDHEKYLTLIDTIAFLHQYQREIKSDQRGGREVEYIEATLDDIALANHIAHEVLGRSLDELPPQTRRLLKLIDQYASAECERQSIGRADLRFSRKAVRDATGLSDTQARLHLERLVQMEYLLVHRGQRGQSFEYELLYDGKSGDCRAFVPGLIDVDALKIAAGAATATSTTSSSRGETGEFAPPLLCQRAPDAAGSRVNQSAQEQAAMRVHAASPEVSEETHLLQAKSNIASYPQPVVSLATAV
ncbi:MAG: DNA primase [Burkholderiales bacterium RIFCSPLOWO2_02_FULL_57_36]|nr:MAG: DNA primase [Burkholderiales bacterium RIFCSPLOWO2_02_FULL_57_36]